MTTYAITKGNRTVKIVHDGGPYVSRLYVNAGETATLMTAKAKTMQGAVKQAQRMLKDAA